MNLNFMEFNDESGLQQALEQRLKVGFATVEDVFLFCRENKLDPSDLKKMRPGYGERAEKHETGIFCSIKAPTGAREFFRLSNWKNILKNFFRLWWFLFLVSDWRIGFYFDNNVLAEIEVNRTTTSF